MKLFDFSMKDSMPEAKTYRERIYALYSSIQVPQWFIQSNKINLKNKSVLIHRLRGWLPSSHNGKYLDLGCGNGDLALALQAVGYHDVTCVDIGSQQVAIARDRGITVVQADILCYLRQSEAHFDVVFLFDVIEHFTKDEAVKLFDMIWSCLNPGGRVILQTPNALSPWSSHLRYDDITHELIFGPKALKSILQLSSFDEIKLREVQPHIHGAISFARWILWIGVRAVYASLNYIEAGESHGGVYSRNMLATALKKANTK